MILKLNGREVEVDLEPGDETMMIKTAGYLDTGAACTEEEIEQLEYDYPERLAEEWEENQRGIGCDYYEGER